MNAQTKIAPADKDHALAFHVQTYVPEAEGEALTLRITLLKARDHAAHLRGLLLTPTGQAHAADVHELAGALVFNRNAEVRKLDAAVKYSRAVLAAAMQAEILEGDK